MVANEPQKLAHATQRWGSFVGRHPKRVLAVTTAVALLFGVIAGAVFAFDDSDAAQSFNPKGNAASRDRDRLHATFGNQDVTPTSVIFTRRDGGNIVTAADFNATLGLHNRLMAVTIDNQDATTRDAKPTVTYADMCVALPTGQCIINSVLRCFDFRPPAPSMSVEDPACLDSAGLPVVTASSLGGDLRVEDSAATGTRLVGHALAVRYDYLAFAITDGQKANNAKWETAATKVMHAFADEVEATYKVSFASAQGLVDEGAALASRDFLLMAISGMAMVVVAVAFTFSFKHPVHSRGAIVYAGAVPIYFAMFVGIAVCGLAGIKYNALMFACPTLFLANAIEVGFVINRSFSRAHHRYTVAVRMGQALCGAGPSIVATQVTQTLVFVVASIVSPFQIITNMSIFVAIATPAHLFFQLSWYCAMLALDGRREAAGRHAFKLWSKPRSKAIIPTGGAAIADSASESDPDDTEEELGTSILPSAPRAAPPTPSTAATKPALGEAALESLPVYDVEAGVARPTDKKGAVIRGAADANALVRPPDRQQAMAEALSAVTRTHLDKCDSVLEGPYGRMLMTTPAKVATMGLLFTVLVLSIVGLSHLRMGLDTRETLAPQSRQAAFFDDEAEYYTTVGLPVHIVIDSPVEYWQPATAAAITHLTAGVGASRWAPPFPPINSWFEMFKAFVAAQGVDMPATEDDFIAQLLSFLSAPAFMAYRGDLVLAGRSTGTIYPLTETVFSDGIRVVASRMTLTATPAYTTAAQSDQLNGLRDAIVAFGSDALPRVYVTGQMFPVYEQQEAVLPFLFKCLAAAVMGGATVASATLPRPALAAYVQLTVLFSCIVVLGCLTPIAGLSLNVVTVVEVLFAAVWSVGFATHITRAFAGEDMQGGRLSSMITLTHSRDSSSGVADAGPSPTASSAVVHVKPAGAAPSPIRNPRASKPRATKRPARATSPPSTRSTEDPFAQLSVMGFLKGFIGGEERQQRALFGLSAMGHPVLNASGAAGTGLACLVFAASYTWRSLGVVLLLAVPIGLLHTLAVLPVITSVIGPKTESWVLASTSKSRRGLRVQ